MAVERLTAEDQVMLWPDRRWPQIVGALAVLDGSELSASDGTVRVDVVRAMVAARLHLVPRFRQVLHAPGRGLGPPLWLDSRAFDIADHVKVMPVSPPGDETQLLSAMEDLRRRGLDRSRPLWEMWLLPGLADRRVGLFVKIHHVVADGMTAVAMIGRLLDADPVGSSAPAPVWRPAAPPTRREIFADHALTRAEALGTSFAALRNPGRRLRSLAAVLPAAAELVTGGRAPTTTLDHVVGPARVTALLRTDLALVRTIAHQHGATVNDVLLSVTTAGLQRVLQTRRDVVPAVVPAYVPVTLRGRRDDQTGGNLISQIVVPLPTGLVDPGQRLRAIAVETARRKTRTLPSFGLLGRSRLARRALLSAISRYPVNVTTADLHGPTVPMYLAGARVLEVFPVLPLIGNVALGVGALSYAGQLSVMATGDRDAFPDIDVLVDGMDSELAALSAGVQAPVG